MVVVTGGVPMEEVNSALPGSLFNLNRWPSLDEAHGRAAAPSERVADSEWELLSGDDDDSLNASKNEAVVTSKTDSPVVIAQLSRPKLLRMSSSTPDFSSFDIRSESSSSAEDADAVVTVGEDFSVVVRSEDAQSRFTTDSSYALVSRSPPTSNIANSDSLATVEGRLAHSCSVPTFKDALLFKSQETARHDSASTTTEKTLKPQLSIRRKKHKPRLIVVPIKRCIKSTGDLRSLASIQEQKEADLRGIQEDDVLGVTDAMEFYHQKIRGAQSRANGMKSRPDEAKRKQISMYKRQAQRQHTKS